MSRQEVDWTALEGGTTGHDPFEVYVPQIEGTITRLEVSISAIERQLEATQSRLFSFSSKSNAEDSFVRHMAMLGILDKHGLLDAYYEPVPGVTTIDESETTWSMRLQHPGKPSYFFITYSRYKKDGPGVQSLYYGRTN
ncbi:MAG TPA: hypothetical protein VLF90_02055 [Patescibacteria group bacterium]|nr:hypothetical protein [Patescibacteria group bacterium]